MTLRIRDEDRELAALVDRIRTDRGFDAGIYKPSFVKRRLAVRLRAREVETYAAYARLLATDPREYDALLAAFAVTLTCFFRDPGAFRALTEQVLAPLVTARTTSDRRRLRIWSAGCASGEEPYSVAIALLELLGSGRPKWYIDIQATDIDDAALSQARAARYDEFSLRWMEPALRRRYCVRIGDVYRLAPEVVEMVHFRRRDLLRDSFPRRMDLILCRNVLIYFARAEHDALFVRFHAALGPGGALLLGRVEIPPRAARSLFTALDPQEHLYIKLPAQRDGE
jgi:chemotaxis methyl-accepting protein methylase